MIEMLSNLWHLVYFYIFVKNIDILFSQRAIMYFIQFCIFWIFLIFQRWFHYLLFASNRSIILKAFLLFQGVSLLHWWLFLRWAFIGNAGIVETMRNFGYINLNVLWFLDNFWVFRIHYASWECERVLIASTSHCI